jgi:nicotinamidase-related amidase
MLSRQSYKNLNITDTSFSPIEPTRMMRTQMYNFVALYNAYKKEHPEDADKRFHIHQKSPIPITTKDVFVIVDMQNDFIEKEYFDEAKVKFNPALGTAGSSDCLINSITAVLFILSEKRNGIPLLATMDSHTPDHISFQAQGGPFKVHAVRGSPGANIVHPIQDIIDKRFRKVLYALKAYHADYDSFGAFPYSETYAKDRIRYKGDKLEDYTGAVVPRKYPNWKTDKNFLAEREKCLSGNEDCKLPSLESVLNKFINPKENKLFLCGLLGDYCVLDTAVTAADKGYKVYIIFDLIRSLAINGNLATTTERWVDVIKDRKNIHFCVVKDLDVFWDYIDSIEVSAEEIANALNLT